MFFRSSQDVHRTFTLYSQDVFRMFSGHLKETPVGPAGLLGLEGLVGLVSLFAMEGLVGLVGMLADSGYVLAISTDPKYFQSKYCLCCSKRTW